MFDLVCACTIPKFGNVLKTCWKCDPSVFVVEIWIPFSTCAVAPSKVNSLLFVTWKIEVFAVMSCVVFWQHAIWFVTLYRFEWKVRGARRIGQDN